MTKKFFLRASPKAVEGIRQAYKGADIVAVLDPRTGDATVVVSIADDAKRGKGSRRGTTHAAA